MTRPGGVGRAPCASPTSLEGVRHRQRAVPVTEVRPGLSDRQAIRRRWYFAIMGLCLVLILLAWNVVRFWSTNTAVVMSVVAAVLPPLAAVVGNWHADR